MSIKLDNLAKLFSNMSAQGMTKTKFDFQFRNLPFSVIYIAEQFPHELLFGCKAHNLFFIAQVSKNFEVATYLQKETYSALVKALNLTSNSKNPFSPNVFFEELKDAIPVTTSKTNIPSITEIASLSRDVEDADKIYFYGWLNHGVNSKPSKDNLMKTRRICGQAAYETCLKHHISSRWTDDKNRALSYHAPTTP